MSILSSFLPNKNLGKRAISLSLEHYYRLGMATLPNHRRAPSRDSMVPRPRPVIISLTTTPNRLFKKTDVAIMTLLRQKFRPDRVILWLSDECKQQSLPKSFKHLIKAGLDIQYRPDVGPHTKLIYALQEYPDCVIVSADDDMFYPSTWLSELYASYQLAPNHIHCHRAHLMSKGAEGGLMPYTKWKFFSPGLIGPSPLLFPTGVGGVLYPPNSLSEEVFNVDAFQRLCPKADDVWFKAMALLKGTPCQKVKPIGLSPLSIDGSQDAPLYAINIVQNDPQIQATFAEYDLYRLL